MQNQILRIVFTGGGSGGPTSPLLAIYEELVFKLGKNQIIAVFWGTTKGPEKAMVARAGLPFERIPSGKLRRYWSWHNLLDPIFIISGFFVGLVKLICFRPHVVVSAGSFVSVPVAYAAWLLRIPHVIFQMDVQPGLANRLMAPVSDVLAYLFEQTAFHFPAIPQKKIGPVVRAEIKNACPRQANAQFGLNAEKPVLLVTGGGQGAAGLNSAMESVLDLWLKRFQIVHLTGNNHPPLPCSHPDYHAFSMIHEGMGHLLARSNLVVTRAGLGTLGELALLSKDAVIVPLPDSHQELNGAVISDAGAGALLSQQWFSEEGLQWWQEFFANYQPGVWGNRLHQLLPPGGSEEIVELILKYSSYASSR